MYKKFSLLSILPFLIISGCSSDISSITYDVQPFIEQNNSVSVLKKKPGKFENGIYQGIVTELLPDDLEGLKHQKFKIKVTGNRFTGEIFLIAHDTSYAPYVPLKVGSEVEIKGDLVLNESPKVLHWTHHGVNTPHPDGYIKFDGKTYQ